MRELVIQTDGSGINIVKCEPSLLELRSIFELLLDAVHSGRFPMPEIEKKEEANVS